MPEQKRAIESKDRLVEAGLQHFSTVGFHDAKISDIAKTANVATGSFYRYFKDKKALFNAVWAMMETGISGKIFTLADELKQKNGDPAYVIATIVKFAVEAHKPYKEMHREIQILSAMDASIAQRNQEREGRVRQRIFNFTQSMQDDLAVTDLVVAAEIIYQTVEQLAHRIIFEETPLDEDTLIAATTDMLKAYLLKT